MGLFQTSRIASERHAVRARPQRAKSQQAEGEVKDKWRFDSLNLDSTLDSTWTFMRLADFFSIL